MSVSALQGTSAVRIRAVLAVGLATLALAGACAERPSAVLGRQVGGCEEALRERAAAVDAIDAAEKRALERNRGRAGELQRIASEGKHAVVSAADLGPCDARDGARGVAVDLADLRARYKVVIDQAAGRLNDTAAKPAPPPAQPQRGRNTKGKSGSGTSGD